MSILENLFKPDSPTTLEKLAQTRQGDKELDLNTLDKPLFESLDFKKTKAQVDLDSARQDKLLASLEEKFGSSAPERKHLPVNNGEWSSEPGNSVWHPAPDAVPQKYNPEGKPWRDIQGQYGIDGIPFKDGYPDFGKVSKGEVEVTIRPDRSKNFPQADIELARQKCCPPEDVKKWRHENGYTWHERQDMKTMQKVPCGVHNNVPHSGGVSEAKKAARPATA